MGAQGQGSSPNPLREQGQAQRPFKTAKCRSMGLCVADSLLVHKGFDGSDQRVRSESKFFECIPTV